MYGKQNGNLVYDTCGTDLQMPSGPVSTEPAIANQIARVDKALHGLEEFIQELLQHISPVMLPLELPANRIPGEPRQPECAIANTLSEVAQRVEAMTQLVANANRAVQL